VSSTDGERGAPAPRGFSTRAIRAASRAPLVEQRPTTVPIYLAATFAAADADELAEVSSLRVPGYSYSRIGNPTVTALADAVAELEGAEAGFALASGMGAVHATLVSLLRAGDRLVATRATYGSTRSLMTSVLAPFGVEVAFVDATDHDAVDAALAASPTRVLYAESIANPTTTVVDHAALADLAHRHGARYVVDNTFASPYVCRPLELGADLVVESGTKYLSGHSDVMAGVVSGPRTLVDEVRRVQIDTGATLDPLSAFLVLRGIQTLAVRMERHAATASALAAWLERQDGVERVRYPGLPSHPQYEVAARQFRVGGGMLAFELAGDRSVGPAFIDALSVPELTASLGSVHTMVVHPPTTSHRQLDDAGLADAGIGPGLLRCSVGLEDLDDLVADFDRALRAVRPARADAAPVTTAVS
jgi:cystathionine beta-lyase/cystathionine gamma-synthase